MAFYFRMTTCKSHYRVVSLIKEGQLLLDINEQLFYEECTFIYRIAYSNFSV